MTFISTNSTKAGSSAGSALGSVKYDSNARQSELTSKSLLRGHTFVATVMEVNQQLQSYRIRAAGMPDMVAVQLEAGSQGTALASRSSCLLGVGNFVLAMTTPSLGPSTAVILGSLPTFLGEITTFGSPELTASSPVGSFKDVISDSGSLNCTVNNFNAGRPVDAYPGDTTLLNTLGCGLFIGSAHATLTSGLDCSLECHYFDSLVRLNSFNFEHSTSGSETSMFSDAGDYTEIKRLNPYVVESLGGTEQYGTVPKASAKDRVESGSPSDVTGTYKPEDPDQTGWWRWLDVQGYLANLKLSFAVVPGLDSTRKATNSQEQDETGVFRQHVDSTGAYTVVSAKSISLIKDCFIPVPREYVRPDDSRGDGVDSILAARSSNAQNMADYTVQGVEEGLEHASLLYAASSSDAAAFKTHRSTVAFRERPSDWTMQEIDDIDLAGFRSVVDGEGFLPASSGVSSSRMFAKLPKVGKLKISAREDSKYFASRSMVMMHEDGSIHIQDGYGSTISMRGGCIDISCPGDITLRPGRNLVGFSGDSVSMIAGNDVELSANLGDIRVQADRNVSVLAGNDGAGGILLETKATATHLQQPDEDTFQAPDSNSNYYGGIWLKAPAASVCAVSAEFYAGNRTSTSTIYMDSGDSGSFTVNGRSHVFQGKQTTFITNKDNPEAGTNVLFGDSGVFMKSGGGFFLQGSSLLAAGLKNDMQFLVRGSAVFSQSVMSGSFAGRSSQVSRLDEDSFSRYLQSVDSAIQKQSEGLQVVTSAQKKLNDLFSESVIGSESTSLRNLTFCYPDSSLRGIPEASKFVMFESDWQQAYRTQGAGAKMLFKGVDSKAESGAASPGVSKERSYFWPGASALTSKFGNFSSGSRFVDDKLRFKSQGFGQPVVLGAAGQSFQDNYTVIAQNGIRTQE
jgi:hypothetical protein